MKFVITDQVILSQEPEGPIKEHIEPFAKFISAQGYALSSIRYQVRLATCFSRWLNLKSVECCGITSGHVEQYLRYRARRILSRSGDAAALNHLFDFLRSQDVIPTKTLPVLQLTPVENCVQVYEKYLRETRNLAEATILNYVPIVRCFLKSCFRCGAVNLSTLCTRDIVKFVQHHASHLSPKRAKLMTCALRSFLSHARYLGEIILDLSAAVPVVANWSMPSIPRGIPTEQVCQLLASIDQRTAIGRRDYAILLLLARLGLRSGEVAFLELNDINWNCGTMSVHCKGGLRNEFPLSFEVGKAISAYLKNGRALSTSRRVFLRAKAPVRGFRGSGAISSIVRHSLERAGINAPTYGAHQFRHGLATEMLRQGASLCEIGDVLGHRHPQTTKIYTKVDIEALRTLAIPWPGGVL